MVAKRRRHQFQCTSTRYSGIDQISWSRAVVRVGGQEQTGWRPSWRDDLQADGTKCCVHVPSELVSKDRCCGSASCLAGREEGEAAANWIYKP